MASSYGNIVPLVRMAIVKVQRAFITTSLLYYQITSKVYSCHAFLFAFRLSCFYGIFIGILILYNISILPRPV